MELNLKGWVEETITRAIGYRNVARLFNEELVEAAREIASEFDAAGRYEEAERLIAEAAPDDALAATPDEPPSRSENVNAWTISALETVLLLAALDAGFDARIRAARDADDDLRDARAALARIEEELAEEDDIEEIAALGQDADRERARIAAAIAAEGFRK